MHSGGGQIRHGVRQLLLLDPVELDVLPGGEMAVAAIIAPGHMGQGPHLRRRERAIGNGDAQHVGVQLQIDAVHQPQRLELFLAQVAGKAAQHLVAKLIDPLMQECAVEFVINIHDQFPSGASGGARQRNSGAADANALAQIGGPGQAAGIQHGGRDRRRPRGLHPHWRCPAGARRPPRWVTTAESAMSWLQLPSARSHTTTPSPRRLAAVMTVGR